MTKSNKQITITQIKSSFGRLENHRACVRGLGLRRMHHTVTVQDSLEVRGMIARVSYMLRVEEK